MTTTTVNTPACVGIIMDGNRRYAREIGIPQLEGHRRGYERLKEMLEWAQEASISYVVVFAFSTENWNRTPEEVSYLMDLTRLVLTEELRILKERNVRIRCVGDRSRFAEDLQKLMQKAEEETAKATGTTLVLALSYGGRSEILSAVNRALAEGKSPLSEAEFSRYLWTSDMPDPDLIIRTGGEKRLSGFLPWQGVYSELFFTETKWPAFSKKEFLAILDEFSRRKRNFGK